MNKYLLEALVNYAFNQGQVLRPWFQLLAVMEASDDTEMLWTRLLIIDFYETTMGCGEDPMFVEHSSPTVMFCVFGIAVCATIFLDKASIPPNGNHEGVLVRRIDGTSVYYSFLSHCCRAHCG